MAVPPLVARILHHIDPSILVDVSRVHRHPRSELVRAGGIESAIVKLSAFVRDSGCIMVVVDADDDCPADLGPSLLQRAKDCRPDIPIGLVLANREFEAWILASLESMSGTAGLPTSLRFRTNPDSIRGAKRELTRLMPRGKSYKETRHQLELSRKIDIPTARQNSDSFNKCYREIIRLYESVVL